MDTTYQTQRIFLNSIKEDYLSIWIESFLVDRQSQNLAKGTIKFYSQKLKSFSDYCDTQLIKSVLQIEPNTIRDYFFYLQQKGNNAGSIHGAYRSIKAFLRWFEGEAEPDNWKNPINKIKTPKVPEQILEPVELEVVYKLIESCNSSFVGIRNKALFLTLLDTACRAQEFLDIKLDDLNLIHGSILIRAGKGRKPRIVGITSPTKKAIRKYLKCRNDDSPFLWIRDDFEDRLSYDGLRAIIVRQSDKIKIKAPSLHSFRRAFSINFLRNGGNLLELQKILGHSSLAVVSKYVKYLSDDLLISHGKFSPVVNSNSNWKF